MFLNQIKILHALFAVMAISTVAISTANARDSFSIGVNIGGFGHDQGYYASPPAYYPAPVYYYEPVIHYREPVYYRDPLHYRAVPRYYGNSPTVISFGYQNFGGHQGYNRGHRDNYRGWDRGHRDSRRGWDRGHGRGRGRDN